MLTFFHFCVCRFGDNCSIECSPFIDVEHVSFSQWKSKWQIMPHKLFESILLRVGSSLSSSFERFYFQLNGIVQLFVTQNIKWIGLRFEFAHTAHINTMMRVSIRFRHAILVYEPHTQPSVRFSNSFYGLFSNHIWHTLMHEFEIDHPLCIKTMKITLMWMPCRSLLIICIRYDFRICFHLFHCSLNKCMFAWRACYLPWLHCSSCLLFPSLRFLSSILHVKHLSINSCVHGSPIRNY